jgi:small basic protein
MSRLSSGRAKAAAARAALLFLSLCFSLFLALAALQGGARAQVQRSAVDPAPGQKGHKFAVYTDIDFQIFIKELETALGDRDMKRFGAEHGVSVFYLSDLNVKMLANLSSHAPAVRASLQRMYGDSIWFTDSEKALARKYKARIDSLVAQGAAGAPPR